MSKNFIVPFSVAVGTSLILGACVGANNASLSTVVEALEGARNPSPYVEAYVQYLGPDARWAGPALWTLHVTARDGVAPQFEVTPALPRAERIESKPAPTGVEVTNRAPASALGLTQMPAVAVAEVSPVASGTKTYSTEEIRERLAHLATTVQAGENETRACSTVVKVRLSRADGSVVEKQGCRGSVAWSQVVSEFSAEFIGASRFPAAVAAPVAAPVTAPVGAPAAQAEKTTDHG
jgi:hypothetical protein